MNSLKNLKESMGCNTIRDDHGGGVIYQRVHMDKAAFDEMLAEVEEEYSCMQAENAKLREYAQALAEVAYKGQMLCDGCRFSHGCYNGGKKEHEGRGCQWWLWARELGIEVDKWTKT